MPGLEGQGDIGELISQGQEVQAHSWQVRFSLWGKGLLVGARESEDLPIHKTSCIRETYKVVGLGPNLREQLPGKLQADLELPLQLLQAQGGPPWWSRESPDTSSCQE